MILSDLIRHQGILSIILEALDLAFFLKRPPRYHFSDRCLTTEAEAIHRHSVTPISPFPRSDSKNALNFAFKCANFNLLRCIRSHCRPTPRQSSSLQLTTPFFPGLSALPALQILDYIKRLPFSRLRETSFKRALVGERACKTNLCYSSALLRANDTLNKVNRSRYYLVLGYKT
jgi:hypothetical protein